MHGFISLPNAWSLALLSLAPLIGVAAGIWVKPKHPFVLWLIYCACYAATVVWVAFGYESTKFPGTYDLQPWAFLVIPVFIFALPAIGLPWAAASALRRAANRGV